jgi:PAS domain-containing protein
MMNLHSWVESFPGAITVCDPAGIVLEMNAKACEAFAKNGGEKIVGTNLLECHPEPARTKLRQLLAKPRPNIYTIETNGVKKLIYQTPWHADGVYRGFVEVAVELPANMPHFVRQPGQGGLAPSGDG